MKRYLITLSSPIAIRNSDGDTRMVTAVEGSVVDPYRGEVTLRIVRYYDSDTQRMLDTKLVDVTIKPTNIRSKQEVRS